MFHFNFVLVQFYEIFFMSLKKKNTTIYNFNLLYKYITKINTFCFPVIQIKNFIRCNIL